MIHSDSIRQTAILGIFTFCMPLLLGCNEDWAKRLDHGRPVPGFQFTLTFNEPSSKKELFQRLEGLAHLAGFTQYRGRPITDEMFEPDAQFRAFDWHLDESATESYTIGFIWGPFDVERPTSVLVTVLNGSLDDFTAKEWLMFKKWKDSYLPTSFPDTTIEVTLHPAAFTSEKNLSQFSEATGVEVPEKQPNFSSDVN